MDAPTRRLLLGDWSRAIRDPIDVVRLVFLAGCVWFAVTGDAQVLTNVTVGAIGVLLARAVDLPRVYDVTFCIAMFFTAWGEGLGLYDEISWYDNVVHFFVPMLSAPVIYIGLARLEVLPDPRDVTGLHRHTGVFVVTLALGAAVGAVWEIVEYASDQALGSRLQLGNADTVGDLIADTSGSVVGAALLVCWTRFGWGSVRRIPGENRFEDTDA